MSVVITVNGHAVYKGLLGTGRGSLCITVRCGCWRLPKATVVYAGDALAVEEASG